MHMLEQFLLEANRRPARTALDIGRLALPYALACYVAYIFLWYLPFKFAPGSHLFQVLEDWSQLTWFEPHFRYLTGSVEALAAVLLFIPGLQVAGGALALGIMSGAIFFHLFTPLGIDPYNDGGKLFTEACIVWLCSLAILAIRRHEILPLIRRLVVDPRIEARLRR
jgi:hypothetical protein